VVNSGTWSFFATAERLARQDQRRDAPVWASQNGFCRWDRSERTAETIVISLSNYSQLNFSWCPAGWHFSACGLRIPETTRSRRKEGGKSNVTDALQLLGLGNFLRGC